MPAHPLAIYEEIMLLCLHNRAGTVSTDRYPFALAGAVLAELVLEGRVRITDEGQKQFIGLAKDEPLGDPILDDWLQKIATAKLRKTVLDWVNRLATQGNLKERVVRQLCDKNILQAREVEVLWIFTQKSYPEINPVPEQAVIQRLRYAILSDEVEIEPRTAILISLADSALVLQPALGSESMRRHRHRIDRITRGDAVGSAAKEAIEAMQAAIMIAAALPGLVAIFGASPQG